MKIYGMNRTACRGKFVVAIVIEHRRYFYTLTSDWAKAQRIAYKVGGIAVYID